MIIKTKFKMRQNVWYITSHYSQKICTHCENTSTDRKVYKAYKAGICGIWISISDHPNKIGVEYALDSYGGEHQEEDLYRTKKDALAWIKKENA